MRRDQHRFQADSQRAFEGVALVQLRSHSREERRDVVVRHVPSKRATSELAKNAFRIDQRLLRHDFLAIAVRGIAPPAHVTEQTTMARRRPRFQQRSFHFDPLHDHPRPVVLVGTDFLDPRRSRQAVRDDPNRVPRFYVSLELDDLGAIRRHFEIVDQILLGSRVHRPALHMELDRPLGLESVSRDAKSISTFVSSHESPERDLDVGRHPRAEDRHPIVDMSIDTADGLDRRFVLDVDSMLRRPRLRAVGNGRSQNAVGCGQVVPHQE